MQTFDIYNQKSQLKIAILIIVMLIGGISFYYTSRLVAQLENREIQEIDLYARTYEYLIKSDMKDNTFFLQDEVRRINAITRIPAIITNSKGEPTGDIINIELMSGMTEKETKDFLTGKIKEFKQIHEPIGMDLGGGEKNYLYYSHSYLLTQLLYYPLIQCFVILLFAGLGFLAFNTARSAEQNRVWVGLAKETAHQLGTPLSSLTAWVEYFKTDPSFSADIVLELEKDIKRLDMITTRFSNIGSVPTLKPEDLAEVVIGIMDYLKKRISTKVKIDINNLMPSHLQLPINRYLFEWVIENISKNAVDAMGGEAGEIKIVMQEQKKQVVIDLSDTGKGMTRSQFEKVFNAGFSTKKRGWGLGLTLAKRIIENYHGGKLFVLKSEVGKGTTFRVQLPMPA